jgi:hypothetical protein
MGDQYLSAALMKHPGCRVILQVLDQVVREHTFNDHMRMVEMCDNHPMFQFLFDSGGGLLAANKRAMQNMKGVRLFRATCC